MIELPIIGATRCRLTTTDGIDNLQLEYIRHSGRAIVDSSPVEYIRQGTLRGSLFDHKEHGRHMSSIDTRFFVDHAGPLQTLYRLRSCDRWPLGELREGHEFLLVMKNDSSAT